MTEAYKISGSLKVEGAEETAAKIKSASGQVDKAQASMDGAGKSAIDLSSVLGSTGAAFTTASVAAASFVKTFDTVMDFGKEGAVVAQTAESFQRLVENIGGSSDVLRELQKASKDTIDDQSLMSSTTALLSGTSGKLSKALLASTPALMEMAKAANKLNPALGDTSYMYQSLALGIKRASPMILDNLGITVSIEQANRKYAESIGKTTEELSKEEQQFALLNAVMEKGQTLINQAGGTTDSAVDSFARFETATKNIGDALKSRFAPFLANAAEGAALLLTANEKINSTYKEHEAQVFKTAKSYEEYADEVLSARVRTGELEESEKKLMLESINLGKYNDWLKDRFGLMSKTQYEQRFVMDAWKESFAGMRQQIQDSMVTEEEYTEVLDRANQSRDEAIESINNYAETLNKAQAEARSFQVEQTGMAESLKNANNAELAKAQIQDLNQAYQDGLIGYDAYKGAVDDLQLSYGIANKASIAYADSIPIISKALEDGLVAPDKMSEAITTMKADAKDGQVDFSKLFTGLGADQADVDKFLSDVDTIVAKRSELTEDAGFIGDEAVKPAITALEVYDSKLANTQGSIEKSAAATEIFVGQVSDLKKMVDSLEDKKIVITTEFRTITGTGSSNDAGAGNASGGSYLVPPGFPHDTWPVRAQSGEEVNITPANERNKRSRGSGKINVYGDMIIQVAGNVDPDKILAQVGR
jgi:hypothetical protein